LNTRSLLNKDLYFINKFMWIIATILGNYGRIVTKGYNNIIYFRQKNENSTNCSKYNNVY